MNQELVNGIAKFVRDNIVFKSQTGIGAYTIQDCFNGSLSLSSIRNIANYYNKLLKNSESNDLFKKNKNNSDYRNQLIMNTLVEVVHYHEDRNAELSEKRKMIEESKIKLDVLREAKAKKEINAIEKKSMASLEKEIKKLESEIS